MSEFYVAVGDTTSFTKTVGEYDVYAFAGISGDFAPNHVDKAYMEKSGYGRLIAHGALLVGYYKGKKLKFAGKVGTGFTTKTLSMLYKKLQDERRDECPFVDLPHKTAGQWSQNITPSMMKKMYWVNPVFVATRNEQVIASFSVTLADVLITGTPVRAASRDMSLKK